VRPISETAGEELLWIQPAARRREHELRAGDDVVATLRFQQGSLADAEADGHHWTLKRQGFWQPRVTVRVPGSDADVAVEILPGSAGLPDAPLLVLLGWYLILLHAEDADAAAGSSAAAVAATSG